MRTLAIIATACTLAACRSTPEPVETVEVEVPIAQACVPLAQLQAVTIPEETEQYTAITMIDNPPYEPIERRETLTRVVKEAHVIYQNAEGERVEESKICERQAPASQFRPMADDGVPVMQGVGARDLTK